MKNEPRHILALETSGQIGSVALGTETGLVAAQQLSGPLSHKAALMPAVDDLLQQQDWSANTLTDVFVSIGPGSFTGLRIGVTIARTLAWSVGAQIVAVKTLDGLARNALSLDKPPAHVAVMLYAQRAKAFAAAFDLAEGRYVRVIDACMADPCEFLKRCPQPVAVLGEGIPKYREAIKASGANVLDEELWTPRAENIFEIGITKANTGQFTSARELLPLYIRRPAPEEKWEQRHNSAPR